MQNRKSILLAKNYFFETISPPLPAIDRMDNYDDEPDDAGAVYLFRASTLLGAETLTHEDADAVIESGGNNEFGNTLAAGDFDGDGTDELIVAMPLWSGEMGRVLLFSL